MHCLERIIAENAAIARRAAQAQYETDLAETARLDALQAAVTIALAAALEPVDRLLAEMRRARDKANGLVAPLPAPRVDRIQFDLPAPVVSCLDCAPVSLPPYDGVDD